MKQTYTHLILLIDRSGSMSSIKKDMEGGLKEFIDKQKLVEGKCTITVAEFDNTYSFLYRMKDIKDIKDIIINPRGSTALIDSMVRLIDDAGKELADLPESERPDKVLFITITDGEENASVEFTNEELKEKIKHQEEVYKWNFTYIGANQDAFNVARSFGISTSNTLNYNTSISGSATMFATLTSNTTSFRNASLDASFTYSKDDQELVANAK